MDTSDYRISTPARQERERECAGCGTLGRWGGGSWCPTCRAAETPQVTYEVVPSLNYGEGRYDVHECHDGRKHRTVQAGYTWAEATELAREKRSQLAPAQHNVPEAPRKKIVLPKPNQRETYAAGCCRLAHQGYLNGARVSRPNHDFHFAPSWVVTSQTGEGGYTVSLHEATGGWECGCEAHAGGRLCSHIAMCRVWPTECPTCAGPLLVYAQLNPNDPGAYQGAVRCTGACGLMTDLTPAEAEALSDARLGLYEVPILALLLGVVQRTTAAEAA
jgi:hypothetical protein